MTVIAGLVGCAPQFETLMAAVAILQRSERLPVVDMAPGAGGSLSLGSSVIVSGVVERTPLPCEERLVTATTIPFGVGDVLVMIECDVAKAVLVDERRR